MVSAGVALAIEENPELSPRTREASRQTMEKSPGPDRKSARMNSTTEFQMSPEVREWWPELTAAVDHVVGHPECSADDRAHWAELGAVFAKP